MYIRLHSFANINTQVFVSVRVVKLINHMTNNTMKAKLEFPALGKQVKELCKEQQESMGGYLFPL